MASPENAKLVALLRKNQAPPASFETMRANIEKMRANMVEMNRRFVAPPGTRLEPVRAGGVPAEWIAAPGADDSRTVLYLHGGGYVIGSIVTHRCLVAGIAAASGCRALALDYRLAPEHAFPAAVDDATAAYRWLLEQGTVPSRVVIAGDSAGGGLTIATLLALRDAGTPLPAAGVCLSPWVDLEGTGDSLRTRADQDPMVRADGLHSMARMYLAGADPRAPLASPVHADLRGLPPLLIQVGDAETLLDDSTRLAARAKAAGVDVELEVWPEMVHVFQAFAPMLPEGRDAIARIGAYVRARTT